MKHRIGCLHLPFHNHSYVQGNNLVFQYIEGFILHFIARMKAIERSITVRLIYLSETY